MKKLLKDNEINLNRLRNGLGPTRIRPSGMVNRENWIKQKTKELDDGK